MNGLAPVVIGHRGAAGYRPEHTLESYRLAIAMGADYVEPDLVPTRDGVLVARHENELSGSTDVGAHREFADRRTTRVVDGVATTGWFTEDFTLVELRTLRARESMPTVRPANTWYDGRFAIATLDEVLDVVAEGSRRRGVTIGVCAELKSPTYFAARGLPVEEPLVAALRRHHLDRPNAPVFVQSFETGVLRSLATRSTVPIIQLVEAAGAPYDRVAEGRPGSYADLLRPAGLREVATYAAGVGVHQGLVTHTPPPGSRGVVADAHAAGLLVHAWTVRDENRFLEPAHRVGDDPDARGDAVAATRALLDAGVDGVITDQADTAVEARRQWLASREARVVARAAV
jgi:glycerophosphoryl diester phosphodiesterase